MTTSNPEISTAKRRAATFGTLAEKSLEDLINSLQPLESGLIRIEDLLIAEANTTQLEEYVQKFQSAVDRIHELLDLDPDHEETFKEKYFSKLFQFESKIRVPILRVKNARSRFEAARQEVEVVIVHGKTVMPKLYEKLRLLFFKSKHPLQFHLLLLQLMEQVLVSFKCH
jgi:hypothetical protein